jgi:transcriptional regulator with XRE-family HTH domain
MFHGVIPTTDPVTPLGEIIEQRRLELGLTKSEAARLAGVSRGTWHEVEAGRRTNMLADTLNLFDKALGWERGTLRRRSRPLDGRPDLVYTTTEGRDVIIEMKTQQPWQEPSSDDETIKHRQRLASMAITLPSWQVHRVMQFIGSDSNAGAVSELSEIIDKLDEILRRMDERNAAHDPSPGTRRPT